MRYLSLSLISLRVLAPRAYFQLLSALISLLQNVSPRLIWAIIQIESSWNEKAIGDAGEIGLMQIKCETARQMGYGGGCGALFFPALNIWYGAKYLRWQLTRYRGDLQSALSAYNAGTATERNQDYVNRVLNLL